MRSARPVRLSGRITFVTRVWREVQILTTDLVVSRQVRGNLADVVLEWAVTADARVAVLRCSAPGRERGRLKAIMFRRRTHSFPNCDVLVQ